MIGDSEKDVKAAENAGCKGILLNNNQKLIDVVKKLILWLSGKIKFNKNYINIIKKCNCLIIFFSQLL